MRGALLVVLTLLLLAGTARADVASPMLEVGGIAIALVLAHRRDRRRHLAGEAAQALMVAIAPPRSGGRARTPIIALCLVGAAFTRLRVGDLASWAH